MKNIKLRTLLPERVKIKMNEEGEEVNPQSEKEVEKAFTDAMKSMEMELSKIGKDVEKKKDDKAAVDAAMKKQPQLAKVKTESVSKKERALREGKNKEAVLNEEIGIFIISLALAIPAIVQLIGKIAKKISMLLGGSGSAGEKLIHAGHHWHELITKMILKGLTFIPGFKQLPTDKQQKIANIVHTVIVASLAISSGVGAVKAIEHGSHAMAGIEGALTAVKAGEVGIGKFLTDSISKLFT